MSGFRTTGELFLDKADLVQLLLNQYSFLRHGEFVLDKMVDNGDHVVIPFAVNTECHPTSETTQDDTPEWLAKLQKGEK